MTETLSYNNFTPFTSLEERIKKTVDDILSHPNDEDFITVLTVLLCETKEVDREISLLQVKNDSIAMKRVTSSVVGLGIGIACNLGLMIANVVPPTLPVILGSIVGIFPFSGAIGYYSVEQPICESRLYEILERISLYKLHLKTLLRLLPRNPQHEYVKKVCETIKTM